MRALGAEAGYDAEDVHCTGAASTWFREVETDEFTCAVRREEGGCDWFDVDVDREREEGHGAAGAARRRLHARVLITFGADRRKSLHRRPRPRLQSEVPRSTGQKLLSFDRKLGARFVAGADEAGRGSLAGPLVVAGVLLDYDCLRNHRVRPLASLNDSKQVSPRRARGALPAPSSAARRGSASASSPRPTSTATACTAPTSGVSARCSATSPPPRRPCLVDGFRLGPLAPEHRAVVDGDTKSAAIAAASIVAKVTRDRVMRRLDALYPALRLRSPRRLHHARPLRRRARARAERPAPALLQRALGLRARGNSRPQPLPTAPVAGRTSAPRRPAAPRTAAPRVYRLRGYRVLGANVWAGGYELDLIVRRGRRLVFCEVKGKTGAGFGDPLEMVDEEKLRRLHRAAEAWLARNRVRLGARVPLRGRRGRAGRARARRGLTLRQHAPTPGRLRFVLAGRHYPRTGALVRTASARARRPRLDRARAGETSG